LSFVEKLFGILESGAAELYGSDNVNLCEHARQCAHQAERAGAGPALIAAALLHDIGHLVDVRYDPTFSRSEDRRHERIGAGYLSRWFPRAVTEPVRLHVPAKRYLCATEEDYFGRLSPMSVRTLELQGGPMSAEECAAFAALPHAADAVSLRRWDEAAKDPHARPPALEHFRACLESVLRSESGHGSSRQGGHDG
jgi:gamma-butyrobetaine dioxygenase